MEEVITEALKVVCKFGYFILQVVACTVVGVIGGYLSTYALRRGWCDAQNTSNREFLVELKKLKLEEKSNG